MFTDMFFFAHVNEWKGWLRRGQQELIVPQTVDQVIHGLPHVCAKTC